MKISILSPGNVTLKDLRNWIFDPGIIELGEQAYEKIDESKAIVNDIISQGKTVYGINTGFGSLAHKSISPDLLKTLQKNLLLSHACGTGPLLADRIVALILLLKINHLSQGYSGVSRELIQSLIALYNAKIFPCIPSKGSVGASGDLAPLAHLSLPLIGEGTVRFEGKIMSAKEGLSLAQRNPLDLEPKEGLALINGLQVSAAICMDALFQCDLLFEAAVMAGALSIDAALGSDVPFDDRIHKAKGYKSQREVAAMYRDLLEGSSIRESHRYCLRVQDPYSLRCQPQIMGAVFHQMNFVRETLQVEVNAVSDNPLVFCEEKDVLSGGNFHGEMIAMAADNLSLALAEMGANSERRIALLIDKSLSGLPAFLVKDSGLNSGFMIAHVTAAAAASENKALAHPHCVDSLPTSANQEDLVSMATNAALRLHTMIDNTATIIAIELLAAAQGIEFHMPLKTSKKLQKILEIVRMHVPFLERDRYFAPDIEIIKSLLLKGAFSSKATLCE